MSAIAAIYNLNGKPVDFESMVRMSNALAHRGTVDHGEVAIRDVGLIHRSSSAAIGSPDDRLPIKSARSSCFITCDARIDNRDDLAAQLSLDREGVEQLTDARLILAAYEAWGDDCIGRLIGDFVFAIWDERQKRLLAARDALGVKHFYYYFQPGKLFAIASEPKGLFELDGIVRELDEFAVGDFLVLNSEDKESTFYKNVRRLPATHALSASVDGIRTWRYWSPPASELKLKSDGEYQEAFREKLDEAVKARLRTSGEVGAFLSGGLDSSAIVCLASKHLRETGGPRLKTFSAVFPSVAVLDKRIDEVRYVRSVIDASGCDAEFIEADKGDPLSFMDKIFWHAESPTCAGTAYMDCMIFDAAERQGLGVLLSGIDGDSTVGYGYEDFQRMAERHMYWRLFRDSRALGRNMPARKHSFKRLFWNRGVKRTVPPPLVALWRTAMRRAANDQAISPASSVPYPLHHAAIKSSELERLQIRERSDHFWSKSFPSDESSSELHFRGLTSGHFSSVLEFLEKVSAAFGIEGRYPFFDRRLVEFCVALPPGQRTYRGWTRSIFRHAMKGILPEDIRWRADKSNIGANIKVNLLKYSQERLDEAVHRNTNPLRRYVEIDVLRKALHEYSSAPISRDQETMLLLSHVHLSNWLRHAGFA